MSTPITFNSVSYSVPAFGDTGYAQGAGNLSSYLIAIATGTLQQAGGTFSLTADVNFGLNFGLLSKYFTSITVNPATAGVVRLAKTDTIDWRNNANSGNLALGINGSDQLTFGGTAVTVGGVTSITGTAHQVIASASTGAVTLSTPQNIDTTSSPTFAGLTLSSPLTVPNGGTGNTTFTAYSIIAAGTTATGTFQNVVGVGTNGQVLTSNGAAALPTWQNVAGTGTVNSGTANHLAYYATSTNAVSDASGATALTGVYTFLNTLKIDVPAVEVEFLGGNEVHFNSPDNLGGIAISAINNGTGNPLIITNASQAAQHFYSIPDAGGNANFVLSEGAATVNGVKTLATQGIIHGTSTNDNAAAGFIGEYIQSTWSAVNVAATTTFSNIANITLTAGDWDITLLDVFDLTSSSATQIITGISTDSNATTFSDLSTGINEVREDFSATALPIQVPYGVPALRVSLSGSQTYYVKSRVIYSGTTPTIYGRISARRMR